MGQRLILKTKKNGNAKGVLVRTNTPSTREKLVAWSQSENAKKSSKKPDNWLAKLLRFGGSSTFKI